MPLITNPDGSHRFVMDEQATSSFDIESLVQARQRPSVGQPIRPAEWNIQPLPGYPGVSYFQLVLGGEGRGVYRQRGTFDQALTDFSEQTLVYDDYEIARLPFLYQHNAGAPIDPTSPLSGRLCGALFQGRFLMVAGETAATYHLFEDFTNGPYDASIGSLSGASFVTPVGASIVYCMRPVQIQSAPALAIGWNFGTVSSLQLVTNLDPFTFTHALTSQSETVGICQTPVDNDSIQVYTANANGGLVKMFNTNVAPGSATYRDGVPLPRGGYTVGLVNLDGNPEVFYAAPTNGRFAHTDALTGTSWQQPPQRLKLLRVDLRALTVYPVATALSYILYATAGDNEDGTGAHDIFYCNGVDHQYMTHGADVPILPSADRPPLPPNSKRFCGGHWFKEGRFYWEEQVYDANNVTFTTVQRFEFDPALGRYGVRPVSRPYSTGRTGLQSMGGPNQPWSTRNNCLHSRTTTEWLAQYQPPRSETGYSKRHQDGAFILTGPAYEASGYRRWPALRPPSRPGAVMALARVTGPLPANLRTGSGLDASGNWHNTWVDVSEAHTLPVATFYGDDGVDELGMSRWRPAVDYPDNDAWCDELDITLTAYRDNVSGNAQRYTPNPGPIVVEGYLREMGAPPPSRHILDWAADRIAADDLSRPLL
jgi:hypothetical protein